MTRECVWDYPRPPRLEPTPRRLRVELAGRVLADTRNGYRVLETSHPPVYYFPPADVETACLVDAPGQSYCEWKGVAAYHDVVVGDVRVARAAWRYPDPSPSFAPIRDFFAFYPEPMDACFVDDLRVLPQPGDFYGGWITPDLEGPFKGGPGTRGW